MDGDTVFAIVVGVVLAMLIYFVIMLAGSFGRKELTDACERDGFFWRLDQKYECKRVVPTPRY